jgi:hypothetical protein
MLDMGEAEDRVGQVDETGGVESIEDEVGEDETKVEQGGIDAVPEIAKKSRAGVTFTKMENVGESLLSPDGSIKPPDRFTEEMLQNAMKVYPTLNFIYQKLLAKPWGGQKLDKEINLP